MVSGQVPFLLSYRIINN